MEELIKKLDSFGYKVENCSNWYSEPVKTDWKYNITKKNDPTSAWNLCKDKNDVKKFLKYLETEQVKAEKAEAQKKQQESDGLVRDKYGYILCKLDRIEACSLKEEIEGCLLSILDRGDFYVEGAPKGCHDVKIYSDKLTENVYKINSGHHRLLIRKHEDRFHRTVYIGGRVPSKYFK